MENLKIIKRGKLENNREYVFRLLHYNIMSLRMLPGMAVNESEIAKLLNISRTPVREAVLMLKEQFLVDVLPQSGSKITLVDLEMMREGYYLRNIIEPDLMRQVAGNVSSKTLGRLRENLEKQKEFLASSDAVDGYFVLDDEFHRIIYEAANKPHIWIMVKNVCSHFDRVRYMDTILMSGDRKLFNDDHEKMYQFLMLGIGVNDNLEAFYEDHIGAFRKRFNKMYSAYPDYFII